MGLKTNTAAAIALNLLNPTSAEALQQHETDVVYDGRKVGTVQSPSRLHIDELVDQKVEERVKEMVAQGLVPESVSPTAQTTPNIPTRRPADEAPVTPTMPLDEGLDDAFREAQNKANQNQTPTRTPTPVIKASNLQDKVNQVSVEVYGNLPMTEKRESQRGPVRLHTSTEKNAVNEDGLPTGGIKIMYDKESDSIFWYKLDGSAASKHEVTNETAPKNQKVKSTSGSEYKVAGYIGIGGKLLRVYAGAEGNIAHIEHTSHKTNTSNGYTDQGLKYGVVLISGTPNGSHVQFSYMGGSETRTPDSIRIDDYPLVRNVKELEAKGKLALKDFENLPELLKRISLSAGVKQTEKIAEGYDDYRRNEFSGGIEFDMGNGWSAGYNQIRSDGPVDHRLLLKKTIPLGNNYKGHNNKPRSNLRRGGRR